MMGLSTFGSYLVGRLCGYCILQDILFTEGWLGPAIDLHPWVLVLSRWLVDMIVLYKHYVDFLISMLMPPKVRIGHSEPDMAHSFIPTRLTP